MKKALFIFGILALYSVVSSSIFVSAVHADNRDATATQSKKETEAASDRANATQTAYIMGGGTLSFLLTQVGGCWTDACSQSPLIGDAGAIGGMGKMIALTFTPSASTEAYVADLLQNMNLAQPAYAQGLGFSALQPVLSLWKVFRDIAYVFFVFIFLIIGFAIMFRKNLGGQTAVTVQQALPRIIVALLAVSFSYAIAGLMIDFMWILMYFLITMFASANLIPAEISGGYAILNQNIFQVFGSIIGSGFSITAGQIIGDLVTGMLSGSGGLNDAVADGVGWITGQLGTLIIFVAILIAMFRTFFSLIKVYFEIILSIIFAPIMLMMGAINGNAFGNWIKGLVANLMVFPVLLVFVIIGYMFINFSTNNSLPQQFQASGFVPPFVPGRGAADQIGLIGGIAAIMLLPEVVAIVGKYKPSSIFDEFAPKALKNAQAGDVSLPLGGGLIGAGRGAFGAGREAYSQGYRGRALVDKMVKGVDIIDEEGNTQKVQGMAKRAGRYMGIGQQGRKYIDDFTDGRGLPGFEPDNLRSQLERVMKNQETGPHESADKPKAPPKGKP